MIYKNLTRLWYFIFKTTPRFIKNVWNFRKELTNYQPWDWLYNISMLRRGLELQTEFIKKKGNDNFEIRHRKISKIEHAIYILKCHENDIFIELAEKSLGYIYIYNENDDDVFFNKNNDNVKSKLTYEDKERNTAITKKAIEIEDNMWSELVDIFNGQDLSKFKTDYDWYKKFDGSGMKWWID